MQEEIIQQIQDLKKQRNAVILVHNYQRKEVQDIADFTGDSLELSRKAANTNADVYLKFERSPVDYEVALARTIGVKEHVS